MTTDSLQQLLILTLNPSLDVSYEIAELVVDRKVPALGSRFDPGGNGINVCRGLAKLGIKARNFCVLAGEIGLMLRRMLAGRPDGQPSRIDGYRCFETPGETRISCTVIERRQHRQFEMVGSGPVLDDGILDQVRGAFLGEVSGNDYAVITGSVPAGVDNNVYAGLTERLVGLGARPVVDASGELLARAIGCKPYLIKPNRAELESLCGKRLPAISDVAREARVLQETGIDFVCVSLGGEGAILVGPRESLHARAPKLAVRSTVGAGDSMVAGLVAAFVRGQSPAEALRLGVACGSGTALQPGTGLFPAAQLDRLIADIEVRELESASR